MRKNRSRKTSLEAVTIMLLEEGDDGLDRGMDVNVERGCYEILDMT